MAIKTEDTLTLTLPEPGTPNEKVTNHHLVVELKPGDDIDPKGERAFVRTRLPTFQSAIHILSFSIFNNF